MNKNTHRLSTSRGGSGEIWRIDARAPLQDVLDSPECPPLLRQTLTGALSWQTRNETPIRRALTSPRIAPRWVAALLALGATVTVERDDGPAEMALETSLGQKKAGHITTLHIPTGGSETRWGEARVSRTPADEPIVTAIAVVEVGPGGVVRQARAALTGVWPEPVGLTQAPAQLVGGPLDKTSIRAVAEAIEKESAPRGDFRGSEEYRRAMAGVLTRRALEKCLRQETGNE